MSLSYDYLITFLGRVDQLKSTPRFTASLKRESGESSADHSWRLAMMAFLLADQLKLNINVEHAMKLAIVHDVAEAVTGDIDAYGVITGQIKKEDKDQHERDAMAQIIAGIPFGSKIERLWEEYLDQTSNEAKFIKALDKIEGYLRILQQGHSAYNHKQFHHTYGDMAVANFPALQEFYDSIKQKLQPELAKGEIEWTD